MTKGEKLELTDYDVWHRRSNIVNKIEVLETLQMSWSNPWKVTSQHRRDDEAYQSLLKKIVLHA